MMPRAFIEPYEPEDFLDRADLEERNRKREALRAAAEHEREVEDRRIADAKVKGDRLCRERNVRDVFAEYRAAGVEPLSLNSEGVPVCSLSLLLSVGWTIEAGHDGKNVLVKPVDRAAKGRG